MLEKIMGLQGRREPSDDQRYWDAALRILQKIDPNLVLAKLPFRKRMLAHLRLWFGTERVKDAWLEVQKPDRAEITSGVAAPLTELYGEGRAFELQVRVLEHAVQLRKAVYRRELRLEDMPRNLESEKTRIKGGASATVRDLLARIHEAAIPSEAAADIVADYWNKLAAVAWEAAQFERPQGEDVYYSWLTRAHEYIRIALEGRLNWTPGQLNLARIHAAEGNIKEAQEILERIIGKPDVEEPTIPVTVSAENPDAITAMILKMAVERNPTAVASHIKRGYGSLSQSVVRKVTESLAGKVDAGLLDAILREVPIIASSSSS